MESAARLITQLDLKPHPEGGWFREAHRAAGRVITPQGERSALTTIYYLLEHGQRSRWHVVAADEIWHFYAGAPLELITYDPRAHALHCNVLGLIHAWHEPIGIVPSGVWQAARSCGDWSLMGCSVGPGFEYEDFELVETLPNHSLHFAGELSRYRDLL